MSEEVLMFWLIHLFLGIIVPVLMLTGCCRENEKEAAPVVQPSQPSGEGWETGKVQ